MIKRMSIQKVKRVGQSLLMAFTMFYAFSLQGQGAGGHIGGTLSDGVLNINLNIANTFTENFFGGVIKECDPLLVVVQDQDYELSKKAVKNFQLKDMTFIPTGEANIVEATVVSAGGFGGEYISISSLPGFQNTVVLGKSNVPSIKPSALRCKN